MEGENSLAGGSELWDVRAAQVHLPVTFGTKGNQVLFGIVAGLATKLDVMYFQPLHAAAGLTAPTVSLQHLDVQLAVIL
jgi:hypothetical protein